ncbi:MAG: sulfatase-like hydrolase/transferase [Bauldia sp.]|nr:sulfatase-like hydrolase/transferase [Bauldia sp.]
MTARHASFRRRNLLVFHFESVSWQTVNAFQAAFPHLFALIDGARTWRFHFSSATSTEMTLAALLHGNDFEMDAAPGLSRPVANNPSLFAVLDSHGYETSVLCATPFPRRPILHRFSDSLPPVQTTNDFGELLDKFEACCGVDAPFAVFTWSQVPHVGANLALAPYARSLEELAAGACAVADNLLGAMLDILRRRDLLDDTTVVVFGDHGDDYWTHGFKNGLLHGIEPYTALIHTPLVIRDPAFPTGSDNRLVSTIDLAATCLDLLGIPKASTFPHSGLSLLAPEPRAIAFSQNFTASQSDDPRQDVRKAFAAIDHSHALQVSARGLALYNHRLDPGNQTNLLNFFALEGDGRLRPVGMEIPRHNHFATISHLWYRGGLLQDTFTRLHDALKTMVTAKNDYALGRGVEPGRLLDAGAFRRIDPTGLDAFFKREAPVTAAPAPAEVKGARPRRKRPASRLPRPLRRALRRLGYGGPARP